MDKLTKKIVSCLPYGKPFLFVDKIIQVSDNKIAGEYRFRKDEFFYRGHFKDNPVTPGVIILETMGQIGLVCFAVYLTNCNFTHMPLLSFMESEYYYIVKPGEKVIVESHKIYFRNNTLRCKVTMHNSEKVLVSTLNAILKLS